MSNYMIISSNKTGDLGISTEIISTIASEAIKEAEGISQSKANLNKEEFFSLNKPVQTSIKKGIAHIKLYIDVIKGINIQKATNKLSDELSLKLVKALGRIPFDIQIQVESII